MGNDDFEQIGLGLRVGSVDAPDPHTNLLSRQRKRDADAQAIERANSACHAVEFINDEFGFTGGHAWGRRAGR